MTSCTHNGELDVTSHLFFCLQAAKKAGLSDSEIKEVLELSTSKEIKDKLKSATQYALDLGVSRPSALRVDSDERRYITM